MWRSVPQIPVRRTRMRTSLTSGRGSGTVSSERPGPGAVFTSASIAPLLVLPCAGPSPSSGDGAGIVRPVDDGILHGADALDLAPDTVTRLEEHGRFAEHAHAGRGAGDDEIAWLE